jgi:hypothetical protein
MCALFVLPVKAEARGFQAALPTSLKASTSASVNADVYLTGQMLQPMFQSSINQSIPQMLSSSLSSMVKQLPQQDQDWALQMANALLQPSATLVSLKPEKAGLLATLKINLYQGDPKAITTSVLVGFKVTNASTIQVTALPPANGGQGLVSGPLTTFTIPIGSLNTINATPQCGDADLDINLKFPVALGQPNATATPAGNAALFGQPSRLHPASSFQQTGFAASSGTATNAYIELPAASLAQLGASMGSIQVSKHITAQNIRVGVQGGNLVVTSDIYVYGINLGTAVSTMTPGASNGNLVVHVLKTDLQFGFLSFPVNSYNQQIQQELNTELTGALTGTFYVNSATIGFNPHLSCASSDSLVLAGALTAS